MEIPLVSVCIPAYNAEKTLSKTLDSILKQDYHHFEIIVSDNHSTDSTREIVKSYSDKGVRYCIPPERTDWMAGMPAYIGAYMNANYVLSQGRGEFLCLYHSDDLYEPDIIRKQVALLQANPGMGAVFTMLRNIGEDDLPIKMGCTRLPRELAGRQVFVFDKLFNAILQHWNILPAPSAMLRRSVFEITKGFNERQFFTSADLEMWLRIAKNYPIGILNEPLLNYRISQQQGGANYSKNRTRLADFFLVMDNFLAQDEVYRVAEPDALALYEMERAADKVLCAMNLLTQKKVVDAQAFLKDALQVRYFTAALHRPRKLSRLVLGIGLLASIYFGLGELAGRGIYSLYQWDLRRRKQPLKRTQA